MGAMLCSQQLEFALLPSAVLWHCVDNWPMFLSRGVRRSGRGSTGFTSQTRVVARFGAAFVIQY